MSGLNVTYSADSLEDLAEGIELMASAKREEAGLATKNRDQRDLNMFADGLEYAADVVRKTTIGDYA